MKSKDQLLLEQAYMNVFLNSRVPLSDQIHHLIEMDIRAIDELIEEGLGDWIKDKASKAGQAIKGGAQQIKQSISSGVIQQIIGSITKKYQEVLPGIITTLLNASDGKTFNKQELDNAAKQIVGNSAPQQTAQGPVKESLYFENKAYLASLAFTESNLISLFEELEAQGLLITEMQSVGIPAQNPTATPQRRSGRELAKFAQEVITKINSLYPKNKQALAAALPQFMSKVSQGLNVPSAGPSSGSTAPAQQGGQPSLTAQPQGGQPTSIAQSQGGQSAQQGAAAAGPANNNPPANGGLISKVMGFVKSHPKISAVAGVAALGLVVSAFAGSTPVIVPALLVGLKYGLTGAGGNLLIQVLKNKFNGNPAFQNIDWNSVAKTGLSAAALGAIGKVLAIGLGHIVHAFDPMTIKRDTKQYSSQYGVGETHTQQSGRRGLASWTGNTNDISRTGPVRDTGSWGYQGQPNVGSQQMPAINRGIPNVRANASGISDF